MKIVILHTDFRIYWPARIKALQTLLNEKEMELYPIEISGKGSPYAFGKGNTDTNIPNWHILFPERDMESLSGKEIKKRLVPILDKIQPEVVIAGAIAFPSGALATAWAKKNKKKIIIFDDAKIEDVQRNTIVNFIKQCIYKNVDAMIYPSHDWRLTGSYWKFKPEQLFYGIDVIDNQFWQKTIVAPETHSKPYFLSIGRQIPVKNYLFVLKAYKLYKDKFKDSAYNLILIGNGPERPMLETYLKENDIEGVELLEFMQQQELITMYRYAEAFILASTKETWGLVLNEAMASGIPVLTSKNCGATSTLVKERRNGYIFSPYREQELVDKMVEHHLLNSKGKEQMKAEALKTIQEWGIDCFAKGVYQAVNYVVRHKSHKPNFIEYIILNNWKGKYNPI